MIKAMVACGCGMGTSQMMKQKAELVFKKHGLEAQIEHTSVEFAKSGCENYDVVIVPDKFLPSFKGKSATVIGVKNILSAKEIEQKLIEVGVIEAL